jgi:hypothetical protein
VHGSASAAVRSIARLGRPFKRETTSGAVKLVVVDTSHRWFALGQPTIEQSVPHPVQLDHIRREVLDDRLEAQSAVVARRRRAIDLVIDVTRAFELTTSPRVNQSNLVTGGAQATHRIDDQAVHSTAQGTRRAVEEKDPHTQR